MPKTVSKSDKKTAQSGVSLPRRVLAHLQAGSAVFFWRQGHWHMRIDGKVRSSRLRPEAGATLQALHDNHQLHESPPGFFRGCAAPVRPQVNDLESPLSRLAARCSSDGAPFLATDLVAAGEKLRRDYELAGLSPRLTASYERQASGGGRHWQMSDNVIANLTDNMLIARQRLHDAMDAVGPELSGILFRVCCLVEGLEAAERHLELPRRSGKAVLALALERLARHYGLRQPLRHGGPSRIGHWAVAGYRPDFTSPIGHPA